MHEHEYKSEQAFKFEAPGAPKHPSELVQRQEYLDTTIAEKYSEYF